MLPEKTHIKNWAISKFHCQLTVEEYVTCILSNITFLKPCYIQVSVEMNMAMQLHGLSSDGFGVIKPRNDGKNCIM